MKSKELIKTVVFFACLALGLFLLRQFVFTPVVVRGHSMDPTLADGERVITLKNTEINRFDIITFPAQMNQVLLRFLFLVVAISLVLVQV
ncbi:signal peptidase I LepB [Enterococcus faecalis]|nr:signal peptidase I LepB [Enterococcus faecalis]